MTTPAMANLEARIADLEATAESIRDLTRSSHELLKELRLERLRIEKLLNSDARQIIATHATRERLAEFVRELLGDEVPTTPAARARMADAAVAIAAEHSNDLVRQQLAYQIADHCRIDAGRIIQRMESVRVSLPRE